jgi:hypothetical protein
MFHFAEGYQRDGMSRVDKKLWAEFRAKDRHADSTKEFTTGSLFTIVFGFGGEFSQVPCGAVSQAGSIAPGIPAP